MELVDAKQMQEVDRYSIDRVGIPSMVLMERAALSVSKHIQAQIEPSARILAVCGTGNNAADAVATLRILKEKGYQGDILLLGNEEKYSEEMRSQIAIAKACEIPLIQGEHIEWTTFSLEAYDICIDGIFGIGLTREIEGKYKAAICAINEGRNKYDIKVVAVDIPSGINASLGCIMGCAIQADITVTFGYGKIGMYVNPGKIHTGTLFVEEIGFPVQAKASIRPYAHIWETHEAKLPKRRVDGHKGTFGKVVLIAGNKNMAGACVLAAKAAYRSGAGLVEVITHEANRQILQITVPEAIVSDFSMDREILYEHIKKADSIIIGPGLGKGKETGEWIWYVLKETTCPVVFDADALNVLAENIEDYINGIHTDRLIFTPHILEMARLLHIDKKQVINQIVLTATDFVNQYGGTLVLKSATTIVKRQEEMYINTTGNSGLGTGGSGDTLSGIIGGFLAQGMGPFEAARAAVYYHGKTAEVAVESENNEYAFTAMDILDGLKKVL